MSLENPSSGMITMLSEEDGTQIPVRVGQILQLISSRPETSFQWWFTDSRDLYCRFRFAGRSICVEFGLDGLNDAEYDVVCGACTALCRLLIDVGAGIGLVVDKRGGTEDAEWDHFFVERHPTALSKALPNVVVFGKDHVQLVGLNWESFFVEEYYGFYFLASR